MTNKDEVVREEVKLTLEMMIEMQHNIQEKFVKNYLDKIGNVEVVFAHLGSLIIECGEFAQENKNWKSLIGKNQQYPVDKYKWLLEYADIFAYLINLGIYSGFTAEEIQNAIIDKYNENIKRAETNFIQQQINFDEVEKEASPLNKDDYVIFIDDNMEYKKRIYVSEFITKDETLFINVEPKIAIVTNAETNDILSINVIICKEEDAKKIVERLQQRFSNELQSGAIKSIGYLKYSEVEDNG